MLVGTKGLTGSRQYHMRPLAPNWRISAFWKRVRETETSENVVDSFKRSSSGYLSFIEGRTSVKSHVRSKFKEVCAMIYTNFTILWLWEQIAREWEVKDKRRPDVLTQFPRFYDHSVSRDPLSMSKNREVFENHGTNFIELWEYVWFDSCFSFHLW